MVCREAWPKNSDWRMGILLKTPVVERIVAAQVA